MSDDTVVEMKGMLVEARDTIFDLKERIAELERERDELAAHLELMNATADLSATAMAAANNALARRDKLVAADAIDGVVNKWLTKRLFSDAAGEEVKEIIASLLTTEDASRLRREANEMNGEQK